MISAISPYLSPICLSPMFHQLAEKLSADYPDLVEAEQVYLKTLAVCAVNDYLQHYGFKTDLQIEERRNSVMQTFLGMSDLLIMGCGRVECCPVAPNTDCVHLPLNVWADHIGYVAVHLNASLSEASLLGFMERTSLEELPINQLQMIEDFPTFLRTPSPSIHLSQWLQNKIDKSWKNIDELLSVYPANTIASVFRTVLPEVDSCILQGSNMPILQRAKPITLGDCTAILNICLVPSDHQSMAIYIYVRPTTDQKFLVPKTRMALRSDTQEILCEAYARSTDNFMQLSIAGNIGECFSVVVSLGDYSVQENFLI